MGRYGALTCEVQQVDFSFHDSTGSTINITKITRSGTEVPILPGIFSQSPKGTLNGKRFAFINAFKIKVYINFFIVAFKAKYSCNLHVSRGKKGSCPEWHFLNMTALKKLKNYSRIVR